MAATQTLHAQNEIEDVAPPVIETRGLTKRFGSVTAVDDLSIQVWPGRVTGFLGANGAGKSTTLRMLVGLLRPTGGEATVLGMPYASLDRPALAVGAVLEAHGFHPLRSGRDHLRVLAAALGIPRPRVGQVLEQVGLTDAAARKVRQYSLGMRQRLALAGALLGDPRALILDEPANGLDPHGIRWLREFLRHFVSQGNAVLVSSHLLAETAQLADDVIVIHRGRLVRQGTVTELTTGASVLRVASPQLDRLATALRARGMTVQTDGDGRLIVRGGTAETVGVVAARAAIPLSGLSYEHSTLEDAFLELTREQVAR